MPGINLFNVFLLEGQWPSQAATDPSLNAHGASSQFWRIQVGDSPGFISSHDGNTITTIFSQRGTSSSAAPYSSAPTSQSEIRSTDTFVVFANGPAGQELAIRNVYGGVGTDRDIRLRVKLIIAGGYDVTPPAASPNRPYLGE